MEFLRVLMFLLGAMLLIRVFIMIRAFIRYDPTLDLVQSGRKYILFLWYNKYNCSGEYEGRKYIKLFEI